MINETLEYFKESEADREMCKIVFEKEEAVSETEEEAYEEYDDYELLFLYDIETLNKMEKIISEEKGRKFEIDEMDQFKKVIPPPSPALHSDRNLNPSNLLSLIIVSQ